MTTRRRRRPTASPMRALWVLVAAAVLTLWIATATRMSRLAPAAALWQAVTAMEKRVQRTPLLLGEGDRGPQHG
jgi:hypothetical protein